MLLSRYFETEPKPSQNAVVALEKLVQRMNEGSVISSTQKFMRHFAVGCLYAYTPKISSIDFLPWLSHVSPLSSISQALATFLLKIPSESFKDVIDPLVQASETREDLITVMSLIRHVCKERKEVLAALEKLVPPSSKHVKELGSRLIVHAVVSDFLPIYCKILAATLVKALDGTDATILTERDSSVITLVCLVSLNALEPYISKMPFKPISTLVRIAFKSFSEAIHWLLKSKSEAENQKSDLPQLSRLLHLTLSPLMTTEPLPTIVLETLRNVHALSCSLSPQTVLEQSCKQVLLSFLLVLSSIDPNSITRNLILKTFQNLHFATMQFSADGFPEWRDVILHCLRGITPCQAEALIRDLDIEPETRDKAPAIWVPQRVFWFLIARAIVRRSGEPVLRCVWSECLFILSESGENSLTGSAFDVLLASVHTYLLSYFEAPKLSRLTLDMAREYTEHLFQGYEKGNVQFEVLRK